MVDRIREILQAKDLSPSQFADIIQVPRSIISHILSGRNKPSLDVVQKIILCFPDLDLRWFLLGQQEELRNLAPKGNENSKIDLSPAPPPEKARMEAGEVEPDKMQKDDSRLGPPSPSPGTQRQIERVLFFYTDHSFSEYRPNP